jgi:folate-binding protein YgfZ
MDNIVARQNPGYNQAISTTAFFQHESPGYIHIAGEDRRDFLQRQSTNNINLTNSQQFIVTVLTSPAARIHDVLIVIDEGDKIGVLTLPAQGQETLSFLQSRIFFMDKVSLEDISQEFVQLDLLGPGALELIRQLTGNDSLETGVILSTEVNNAPLRILYQRDNVFRFLVHRENAQQIISELQEHGVTSLSSETYNILRVEVGLPAAGHELTEGYTPLETGLNWTISEDKGCYTGQEVIARQINYDKITRHLVGIRFNKQPELGESLYPRDKNQPVGKITSIAQSPRFGFIALAILKRPYDQPGSELRVAEQEADISGTVSSLPFQENL